MKPLIALLALVALPALAQQPLAVPPAPPEEVTATAPAAAVVTTPEKGVAFSVQLAANIGLVSVDLQVGHFYTFAAGNIGVPLLTNGAVGAFAGGVGYTFALSQPNESMWFMDLLALVNPGWISGQPFVGLGAGIGLRYLHRSGFTLSFKIPLLGGAIGTGQYGGTAAAVGYFFLANAIALPVFSLGYRF